MAEYGVRIAKREDIPRLASRFAGRIATKHGKSIRNLTPELIEWLKSQEWEGNVRELENMIERADAALYMAKERGRNQCALEQGLGN